VLAKMRERGDLEPVLMLTVHGQLENRVAGLDAGADDYVVKPCEPSELAARVRALLRRQRAGAATVRTLRFGPTTVNLEGKTAETAGAPLALTRTEYALLEVLASNLGRPVAREKILESVWGYSSPNNTHTVETHIWRLRKKLGDDSENPRWIVNQKGLGYVMQSEGA
jgi:two-component system, OmpR family, response regulator MprA